MSSVDEYTSGITSLTLDDGETVHFSFYSKESIEVLINLKPSERWFLFGLDMKKDDKTNEVVYTKTDCPLKKRNTYPKAIAGLINKNMIIRIKPNHYMISPHFALPICEHYQEVVDKWYSLGGKLPGTTE